MQMSIDRISNITRLVPGPKEKEPSHELPFEDRHYFPQKAFATRALGFLLLIFLLPLMLLLIALVRCTSRGPGIYGQKRVGRRGQVFTIYKLRTMYQDAEAASGPVWCKPGDSRITPLGRVLRFFHLDELPQLLNVVRGEMDLIGPRPERPKFVKELSANISNYAQRLTILPGITGLAQINLPADETEECVRRKVNLDIEYIQTASLGLDARILLCTAMRMMGVRYGYGVRLLRLDRQASPMDLIETTPCRFVANGVESVGAGDRFDRADTTENTSNGNGFAPHPESLVQAPIDAANGSLHNGHPHDGHPHNGNGASRPRRRTK